MRSRLTGILILLFLISALCSGKVSAISSFTVEPILKNQASSVSFFHKKGQPGQTVTFQARVKNNDNVARTIDVEAANGFSNPFGSMNYSSEEETTYSSFIDNQYKLASYVKAPEKVTLKGRESKIVTIQVNVPKNLHKGQILGAVNFTLSGTSQTTKVDGKDAAVSVGIKERYSVAILLDLPQKTETLVELGESEIDTKTKTPEMKTLIRNVNPVIAKDLTLQYKITKLPEKKVVLDGSLDIYDLAPSTNIRYPITFDNKQLKEGEYSVETNVISKTTKKIISHSQNTVDTTKVPYVPKKNTPPENKYANQKEETVDYTENGKDTSDKQKKENEQSKTEQKNPFICYLLLLLLLLLLFYIVYRIGKKKGERIAQKEEPLVKSAKKEDKQTK